MVEGSTRRWIIVGLGNPGPAYERHRHNVGRRVVSALAKRLDLPFHRSRGRCRVAEGMVNGTHLVLARPQTFMNVTGTAVKALLQSYRASPRELLVVLDDMDLPLGRIRLRPRGSAGGHRGLESIIAALGTQDFPRLRIGIGRPPEGMDPVEFVLQPFTDAEQEVIAEAEHRAVDAVFSLIKEGLDRTMGRYNQ